MKACRPQPENPRSILVLKPSSFGDIIHSLPAVARLKKRWPDSRVSWLVNTEWAPLLRGNPVVDEVVVFPRQQLRGPAGLLRTLKWLRDNISGRRPDLTLDYQGLLRTALIGRMAGGSHFVGMADAREGSRYFYHETVHIPNGPTHAVERYLALSAAVTGHDDDAEAAETFTSPLSFSLPPGQAIDHPQRLESRFVLLHPFARGEAKSLTVPQVQTLCAALAPYQVIVVGSWSGPAFALPPKDLNLLNETSLLQLLWLMQHAGFVISVDSGPVHLAAALHKPLVAIHSWSDPRRVGPYHPAAWVLKNGQLLRVAELVTLEDQFFSQPSGEMLPSAKLAAICRLATSILDSFA